jgi:hypothetical protein
MSGNELQRIQVLSEVLSGRRTQASAAPILGISTRQTRRLIVAYRAGGGAERHSQEPRPRIRTTDYWKASPSPLERPRGKLSIRQK